MSEENYNPWEDDFEVDDCPKCCPSCETPNQFGEVCHSCQEAEHEDDYYEDQLQASYDETSCFEEEDY